MQKIGDGGTGPIKNIDAELGEMCIELMRVREKAKQLDLDLVVYLAGMCIDEVREHIGGSRTNFDTRA